MRMCVRIADTLVTGAHRFSLESPDLFVLILLCSSYNYISCLVVVKGGELVRNLEIYLSSDIIFEHCRLPRLPHLLRLYSVSIKALFRL